MNRITLRWKRTTYARLASHDDYYFYAITRGTQLLYVGNTQDQHIQERIKQHVATKFNHETRGLTFWLADIESTTVAISARNLAQIIHDVESLLIFRNQPVKNHHCKVNYTGGSRLRVLSHDCPWLKQRIESPA